MEEFERTPNGAIKIKMEGRPYELFYYSESPAHFHVESDIDKIASFRYNFADEEEDIDYTIYILFNVNRNDNGKLQIVLDEVSGDGEYVSEVTNDNHVYVETIEGESLDEILRFIKNSKHLDEFITNLLVRFSEKLVKELNDLKMDLEGTICLIDEYVETLEKFIKTNKTRS